MQRYDNIGRRHVIIPLHDNLAPCYHASPYDIVQRYDIVGWRYDITPLYDNMPQPYDIVQRYDIIG